MSRTVVPFRSSSTRGTVTVIIDDPSALATKILRPGGEIMRVTRRHAEKIAVKARTLAPVASGQLRGSIKVQQNRTNRGTYSRGFTVVADVPYSMFVERGRGPGGMPPVAAIRRWTGYKAIDPAAAYPIARAIGRRGTKAQPFMAPALRTPFTG